MFFYGMDASYFIYVLPAVIFALYAQHKVNSTFQKYSKVHSQSGYTGAEIARRILNMAGIYDVEVEPIKGNLTDHYDPRKKVLRLSQTVYNNGSVAALGVAAHEVGHAIQHQKGYAFLLIRNAIVPAVNFSSTIAMPLILIGFFLSMFSRSSFGSYMILIGIVLFSAVVLFQIITLPVEFNASHRALKILGSYQFLQGKETKMAKKVLDAAALTYLASAAVALANLLRFVMLFNGSRRD